MWQARRMRGISLAELLAVVVIIGIVAALTIPRISTHVRDTNRNACFVNQGDIEIQAQLWYRNKGSWPATDLSDVGSDADYFPGGLPTCPVDGTNYTFDAASQEVGGHAHN